MAFEELLDRHPDYELAARGITTIYVRRGQASQAVAFVEPLANAHRANLDMQALYAETLVEVKRFDEAWMAARRALKCDERFVPAMVILVKQPFTLTGLAGLVLTVGMAVDANVLIYERIREEAEAGADLKTSIRLGYEKALSTIIDANVTNLIVCFVLGFTATAEVKGFAITLGIGIIATLFSALFITRQVFTLMVDVFGDRGRHSRFAVGANELPFGVAVEVAAVFSIES